MTIWELVLFFLQSLRIGDLVVFLLQSVQTGIMIALFVRLLHQMQAVAFSPNKHYRLTCQTCPQQRVVNGPELRELTRGKMRWTVRTSRGRKVYYHLFCSACQSKTKQDLNLANPAQEINKRYSGFVNGYIYGDKELLEVLLKGVFKLALFFFLTTIPLALLTMLFSWLGKG